MKIINFLLMFLLVLTLSGCNNSTVKQNFRGTNSVRSLYNLFFRRYADEIYN